VSSARGRRCANGLRVGCLYTRNAALLGIFDNLGYFASISTPTQARAPPSSGPDPPDPHRRAGR